MYCGCMCGEGASAIDLRRGAIDGIDGWCDLWWWWTALSVWWIWDGVQATMPLVMADAVCGGGVLMVVVGGGGGGGAFRDDGNGLWI